MEKYKLTGDPSVILDQETGNFIPEGHRLWDKYEQWLSAGNTPDPEHDAEQLAAMQKREQEAQASMYGRPLAGSETELETAKLKKIQELKTEMRKPLSWQIGDTLDNVADAVRTIVMARCIATGHITDESVIGAFDAYCTGLLAAYGGAEANMAVLKFGGEKLLEQLAGRYYPAKLQVEAAQTVEAVEAVILPELPQ